MPLDMLQLEASKAHWRQYPASKWSKEEKCDDQQGLGSGRGRRRRGRNGRAGRAHVA